jgi:hypothetical protein
MSKERKLVLMTHALADNTWKQLGTGNDLRNGDLQSGLAKCDAIRRKTRATRGR